MAFFVMSNAPIVVYAYNSAETSSDSYSAIPISNLGTEYYTINRANDHYSSDPSDPDDPNFAIRSGEFMIMAVHDNTVVTITPKYYTENGAPANVPFQVTLNRGDCYLVKGEPRSVGVGDLTGSHVVTSKPVALLSGHVRSSVPTKDSNYKDHLVEMLPPVASWGKSYPAVPFAVLQAPNVVRMVAHTPNTVITVRTSRGTTTVTLARPGDYADIDVREPTFLESDTTFLAAQIMPSMNSFPASTDGDPALVVLPAVEQFVSSATFRFPELLQQILPPNQRFYYYINLVAEEAALPSLRLDGRLVTEIDPMMTWQMVPGTTLRWTRIRLALGTYTLSADSGAFAGIMYGMTRADSYANLLGASFDHKTRTNPSPPKYSLSVECGYVHGIVTDVGDYNPKLELVEVQSSQCINYAWQISAPSDSLGTTELTAWIRDLWKDARLIVHAFDQNGDGKEWRFDYDAPNISVPKEVTVPVAGENEICVRVPVVNLDSTPCKLDTMLLEGDPRLRLQQPMPGSTTIAPLDTLWVTVCYAHNGNHSPATGKLIVGLDCDLRKDVPIAVQTTVQLVAYDVDFGAVRIGDTACSRTPVVNTGSVSIDVRGLWLAQVLEPFIVDTSALGFPITLAPGDTLWVNVCYQPTSTATSVRTDTVDSPQVPGVTVTYQGRGIRPEVPSIVIDWGRRRVGKRCDTSAVMENLGEAACVVAATDPVLPRLPFSLVTAGYPLSLPSASQSPFTATFVPDQRGSFTDTVQLTVDWRFHEPVTIVVSGEGTMPGVKTIDVDMGSVVINTTRDSTASVLEALGNEDLTLSATSAAGPDTDAFTVAQIAVPTVLAVGGELPVPITFAPTRLGYQETTLLIENDAAPYGEKSVAAVRIYGVGIEFPVTDLRLDLLSAVQANACTDQEVSIQITNSGNTPVDVEGIELSLDNVPLQVSVGLPFTLVVGSDTTIVVPFTPTRSNVAVIEATVTFDQGRKTTSNVNIAVEPGRPTVSVTAPEMASPGETVQLGVEVVNQAVHTLPEPLTLTVSCPRDRWIPREESVTVSIVDALGSRNGSLDAFVVGDELQLTLDGSVTAPYTVRFGVGGKILWRDIYSAEFSVRFLENTCSLEGEAGANCKVDACGGAARMVRFGTLAVASLSLDEHPVVGALKVQIEASQAMSADLELVDQQGRRWPLATQQTLEKGSQHCIFSVSSWPLGLYGLVMRCGSGEATIPVLVVN
jgi:hypothetical protein